MASVNSNISEYQSTPQPGENRKVEEPRGEKSQMDVNEAENKLDTKTGTQNPVGCLKTCDYPKTVYFAAALFSYQELAGNILLGEAIERVSHGRYKIILPQNGEQDSNRGKDIRDDDLASVAKCDMILLNYDGTEICAGCVVEQQFARDLDKPAVVVRTDFRRSGDCDIPYNLMAGYNPRTELVIIHSMYELKKADEQVDNNLSMLDRNKKIQLLMADSVASQITLALDKVAVTKSIMPIEHREIIQEWAIKKLEIGPRYAAEILASLKEQNSRVHHPQIL